MAKIKLDNTAFKQLEQQVANYEKFAKESNRIFGRACRSIEGRVRQMMLESLTDSGLKDDTGKLRQFVATCRFLPGKKGLRIVPPGRRGGGWTGDDYAKAGALHFGALRKSGIKGQRSKRKLKKAFAKAGATKGTGISYVKAHPFFKLSSSQIKEIEQLMTNAIQAEFAKLAEKK